MNNHKKIFIEAGANDGIFQSRSLDLDNDNEFLGILIEPIFETYEQCKINRPKCLHYYCALVDSDYGLPTIDISIHKTYSAMNTLIRSSAEQYTNTTTVPARTLDSILEENNINNIEYFFLDVEGYEINVLKGIDFSKRFFNLIEVECHHHLINIPKEQEVNTHVSYLNQFGYVLTDENTQQGNLKLIFKRA